MDIGFANQSLKPLGYVATAFCTLFYFLQTSRILLRMSLEKQRLSVVIIACNERARLPRLLATLSVGDEVIVVDSGSTDGTVEWATQNGCRVVYSPWEGYVSQKNKAISFASYPWVLSLDCDEWLSPELADDIYRALHNPTVDSFVVTRCNHWITHPMRFGVFGRDKAIRLFRKGSGIFEGVEPHDKYICQGTSGALSGLLHHQPYASLEEHLQHIEAYSSLAATDLQRRGQKANLADILLRPLWHLFRSLILQLAWCDGPRGILVAVLGGYYTFLKWGKLWWKQRSL